MRAPDSKRPDCFKCLYFYITHDAQRPYGCQAFGMKSKPIPSLAVFQSSGEHCQLFQAKPRPNKATRP